MKAPFVAKPAPDRPRPTPPVTAAYVERAALHYLERYSASTAMLRRTLQRRVTKRALARGEDPAAFAEMIEAVVERAVAGGLADDARFAATRLATLRRRGTSARGASAKLAVKGVPREVVEAAMGAEGTDGDPEVAETAAARAYARRRRLGPHRPVEARAANRERDLAAMARAGFRYGLARRIVEGEMEGEVQGEDEA